MTITIADGRGALWQWDTGRRVKITDGDGVKQVHYQNRCFGRSVDVPVGTDGTAIIPDELLQDWHPLTAYAYVTDDKGGYTKVQQDFAVYKRPKPSDYVYTPTEHAGFDRLRAEIGDLSALQTDAKDTLVAAINEAAASGGADWAQNDPAAKDYVKNRPGGYDVVTPEKIISEWGMHGSNYVSIELSEPLVEGRSYRLTFSENADYSNPVFDSEVVASIDDSNDSVQKGRIFVTVKGYASVVQPATYPEDSAIYSCNNDCRNGYCRLIALARTETVKIPDKYITNRDFIINGTINISPGTLTLDKTFDQIQEAIRDGKRAVVHILDPISGSEHEFSSLPLLKNNSGQIVFSGTATDISGDNVIAVTLTISKENKVSLLHGIAPTIAPDGTIKQLKMSKAPTEDMQIATKKYVDDALDGKAGTAEATAGAAGLMSAADKTKLDGIEAGANKTTVPTALKNPNALTIKIGSTTVTYDGSAAKTVEIADGSEVSY